MTLLWAKATGLHLQPLTSGLTILYIPCPLPFLPSIFHKDDREKELGSGEDRDVKERSGDGEPEDLGSGSGLASGKQISLLSKLRIFICQMGLLQLA